MQERSFLTAWKLADSAFTDLSDLAMQLGNLESHLLHQNRKTMDRDFIANIFQPKSTCWTDVRNLTDLSQFEKLFGNGMGCLAK